MMLRKGSRTLVLMDIRHRLMTPQNTGALFSLFLLTISLKSTKWNSIKKKNFAQLLTRMSLCSLSALTSFTYTERAHHSEVGQIPRTLADIEKWVL